MSRIVTAINGLMLAGVLTMGVSTVVLAVPAGTPTNQPAATAEGAAPEGDPVRGKTVYTNVGRCTECHGWGGDGTGSNPRSPGKAANLRETQLDAQGLYDIIACGIPGTPMPYHLSSAYRNADVCYGMTAADFGEGEMPPKGKTFREKDVWNLVAFIEEWFKPKAGTKADLAECEEFFGGTSRNCAGLK
jgi:mono/diheme cytochrome c family protein